MARIVRLAAISAALALVVAAFCARVSAIAAPRADAAHSRHPQEQDLGPTSAGELVSASIVLKVRHPEALEAFVARTQDPRSRSFHDFLSLHSFVSAYAPDSSDIRTITRYLDRFGITVTDVYADHLLLKATGTADAFNRAFAVDLHDFTRGRRRFHRPRHAPRIPQVLSELLVAVIGPSDEARFHPMHRRATSTPFQHAAPTLPTGGVIATGVPGDFTVGDVANMYNINPLYAANINGHGRTVGIATLADFLPQDAYDYWNAIGLAVAPNRITQVHLDGGAPFGADEGSGETSLDVEQSGGIAPAAKIIVYDAPNSDPGFMDLFYRAASDNLVDSLSVSWGEAEEFYFESVSDADRLGQIAALHQVFLESAAQGISLFCASGDNGAYDINVGFNDPVDNVLSVDVPASDPAITAGGGTTTPLTLTLTNPPPNTPPLVVDHEQVWGWDYIQDYLVKFLGPQNQNSLFPVGTGGGVSILWRRPGYQSNTRGLRRTEHGQRVIFDDGSGAGPQDLLDLPGGFAGRNVPDVSLDADPFSGFIIVSSADGGLIDGFGGTSFVAPQLNGITALLGEATHRRLGLLESDALSIEERLPPQFSVTFQGCRRRRQLVLSRRPRLRAGRGSWRPRRGEARRGRRGRLRAAALIAAIQFPSACRK